MAPMDPTDPTDPPARRLSVLYTAEQLRALRVCGALALALYSLLLLAVAWRTWLHVARGSRASKRLFHAALLAATALCFVDPVTYISSPESDHWVGNYVVRLYVVLAQCLCKSYLAVCWAGVVSAGQTRERRRVTTFVVGLNLLVVAVGGVALPAALAASYADDAYGQYAYIQDGNALRRAFTTTVEVAVVAYALLLVYQAARLRRRLLLARGTVPAGSVEKSLYQLMLTVAVFLGADAMRLVSLQLYESGAVTFSILSYMVLNSLVPNIFPTICMLYLMRRLPSRGGSAPKKDPAGKLPRASAAGRQARGDPATLSRYMDDGSDGGSTTPGSVRSSSSTGAMFALGDSGAAPSSGPSASQLPLYAPRKKPQHAPESVASQASSSPAFRWLRE